MSRHRKHNITAHHIRPKSRDESRRSDKRNIAMVNRKNHERYHSLFGNRLPEEIVEYLNCVFWNGNYKITIQEVNYATNTRNGQQNIRSC